MTVVVTSLGIVSPLGRSPQDHLSAVAESRSAITRLAPFPSGTEIDRPAGVVHDEWIDHYREDRATRLALSAARDALEAAPLEGSDPDRVGVIVGTGLGGMTTLDAAYERLYGQRNPRVHPMTIPSAMANAPTSAVARLARARGPAFGIVSACTSGLHAVAQAAAWIRGGLADVVIAGGADSPLTEGVMKGWEALRVLAPTGEDPARACRPFSADRQGLVLAEGAAILILEDSGHARRAGRAPLASIDGFGMTSDAGHATDPSADGMARALAQAIGTSKIDASRLDYINAHGTATRQNDPLECAAMRDVLGERAGSVMVSSTKAMHGHTMGASGALELALTILALNEGIVPPTLHLEEPDPECNLDLVPLRARRAEVRAFAASSFGFGGLNAVVVGRPARALW